MFEMPIREPPGNVQLSLKLRGEGKTQGFDLGRNGKEGGPASRWKAN